MLGLSKASGVKDELAQAWQAQIDDFVVSLSWSPDGKWLAAASVSGPIAILDASSGRMAHRLSGHGFGTMQIAWSADGKLLASAGQDGKARLWDPLSGAQRAELEGGAPWVERLAWAPRGNYLATAAGRRLRLWNADGELIQDWPLQNATIADIAWNPRHNTLASCGYNGLCFWSPDSNEATRRFDWKGSMLVLSWSPDAKYIATGNQDSTIQFWIMATGKELHMWGYPAKIRELSWDARSRYLASGGAASVVVWDCSGKGPAGTKPVTLDFHERLLTQLAFQREGSLLASGCEEGLVAVWRPGKSDDPLATAHLESAIGQLAWSPDHKILAAGAASGRVAALRMERL